MIVLHTFKIRILNITVSVIQICLCDSDILLFTYMCVLMHKFLMNITVMVVFIYLHILESMIIL